VLDPYQQAFCDSITKDIRLLAPAGSGKTLSLLYRCKAIADRTEGRRFLIVTFTRAARDELQLRLSKPDFASLASQTEVTTLNSWGWRRVRERHHSPKLLRKADRNFAVQNSLQPIWRKYKRIGEAIEKRGVATGKVILSTMDELKNLAFDHKSQRTLDDFRKHIARLHEAGADALLPQVAKDLHEAGVISGESIDQLVSDFLPFWRDACKSLIDQSVFTLDDQKYVANLNIREQIAAKKLPLGGSKFSDIMIDEFQDISPLDLELILGIAELHRAGITIVGDDDQAIFEWRGATPTYILDPDKWLGRTFETFILERNYRCPRNLVEHSQSLIVNNKRRHLKRVEPRNLNDASIDVVTNADFASSIDFVVERVERFLRENGGKDERIALISRKRAQLIPYQIVLAQKGINFCAAEDLQVFLGDSFESLIQMLTARLNADQRRMSRQVVDDLLTLCNRVRRYPLSKSDKETLRQHVAHAKPRTTLEAVDLLASYGGKLKGDNADRSMSIVFAEAVRQLLKAETVQDAIEAIGDHFYGMSKDYGRVDEDIFYADPPFYYLGKFAERYDDDFEQFLEDIETAIETLAHVPPDDGTINDTWSRPVHLMTAIRAKGKEFHTVVLLDVNDGIWPMKHAETAAQKEGERRVFYVAMTRAKSDLLVTISESIGNARGAPSPFLAEARLVKTLV
jgi:DNA helicase-2/ATP-dependent DNA helicase PcrA